MITGTETHAGILLNIFCKAVFGRVGIKTQLAR